MKLIHGHRNLIIVALLLLSTIYTRSQESSIPAQFTEQELRDMIETIAENRDAELDYTELIEDLQYFLQHPLNLNFATHEELEKLIFLNEIQIFHILAYRENYGYFNTIYELQAVDGMDEAAIRSILPFVEVSPVEPKLNLTPRNIFKWGRHAILGRYQRILQEKDGYVPIEDSLWEQNPNSHYLGGPEKLYVRYGFNAFNRVRFGVTAEKDPGEPFFTTGIPDSIKKLSGDQLKEGFDYFSFHAGVHDIGFLKALSLGDYQLRFGQGLTMWSGLAFGKSTGAVDIKKFQPGVSPYTSSDENRFFRGAASTLDFGNLEVTAFYSKNRIDATSEQRDSLSQHEFFITNLQESGLHRTVSEVNKKNAITMNVYGGNIGFNYNRLKIGLTGVYTRFNQTLELDGALYNRFYFNGKENINTGLDYGYLIGKFSLFGEVSHSQNGGWAQLHGITANVHPRFYLSLLYRNYQKEYQNFFCNPFAESNAFNEQGFYTGLRFDVAAGWLITAYMDHFSFPWLRYYSSKPSIGSDYFVQLDRYLNNEVNMYFRFKQKTKPQNLTGGENHSKPVMHYRKSSFRYNISYQLTENIVMKDRLEFLLYKESDIYKGTGFLVFHDINWSFWEKRLALYFRYALFDTDSYDERIYAYENDMLYAFSVPAYYYKGSKIYLMTRLNLGERVSFWARYSHIWLKNREEFGSGLELIDGNTKSEVKFQVMVKL